MKKLLLVLFIAVLIYGCNKDDSNPITTNQGTSWNLIFSKPDSIAYLDTAYLQKIAYVHAEYNSKCWVKFSYLTNSNFKFKTRMRNGQYINYMEGYTTSNWLNKSDSILFKYANYDTLYYDVIPAAGHFVSLKNIEVYIK